jgi:hypothetical protein
MKPVALIESERFWQQLEPLLEMRSGMKQKNKALDRDITMLARAYAIAADREARAS